MVTKTYCAAPTNLSWSRYWRTSMTMSSKTVKNGYIHSRPITETLLADEPSDVIKESNKGNAGSALKQKTRNDRYWSGWAFTALLGHIHTPNIPYLHCSLINTKSRLVLQLGFSVADLLRSPGLEGWWCIPRRSC